MFLQKLSMPAESGCTLWVFAVLHFWYKIIFCWESNSIIKIWNISTAWRKPGWVRVDFLSVQSASESSQTRRRDSSGHSALYTLLMEKTPGWENSAQYTHNGKNWEGIQNCQKMMKALPIPTLKMNQVWCWFKENLLLVLTFLGECV